MRNDSSKLSQHSGTNDENSEVKIKEVINASIPSLSAHSDINNDDDHDLKIDLD